jgi:ATP-binding cassette subfamily B protein
MSLGDFAAFNSYLLILIFPVILMGFMGNVIAQAGASFQRIGVILNAPQPSRPEGLVRDLRGHIALHNVSLAFGDKMALRNVSLAASAGTRTAIIGPTGAGKTQILHLLIGLMPPTSGSVTVDGEPIGAYDKDALHRQVALVFQDSAMFNLTLRENITFGGAGDETQMWKAIRTAELTDFLAALPQGLETVVSERGSSLSGGQKQRVLLARALVLNPKILLLDDFTARVDAATERAIVKNVGANYPGITVISVTQNIAPVMDYDQIILLMDGEVLAAGTHPELMRQSPEYVQFFNSQRSTSQHEIHA